MTVDLWGDIPSAKDLRTPHAILLEQANLLTQKTKGLLVGDVTRQAGSGSFRNTLRIVAPSLNNYIFIIATVAHQIEIYPLDYEDSANGRGYQVSDEASLYAVLSDTLSSERVRRVIAGLLAQIQADEKS